MHNQHALNLFPRLLSLWHISPRLRIGVSVALIILVVFVAVVLRPPSNFPERTILTVREQASVSEIAEYLKDQHAISSPFLFKVFVKIFNPKNGVLSGSYYFSDSVNIARVAYRLAHGKFGLTPLVLTVPEGNNVYQIAQIVSDTFAGFDKNEFINIAEPHEGYLFPDTYYFLPTVSPREVVEAMRQNFGKRIVTLEKEIREFGRPLDDVIKMASYLEEEARLKETRRMIAGILWKRLESDMPLQIDSSFQYVNGKNTYQLTLDDLRIDNPYNTYKFAGLTPTPISNPGLEAIRAAVTPIKSKYFYFLSDKGGTMYYAVTHDEHVANKARYLR